MLLKYEDLRSEPEDHFSHIIDFLGWPRFSREIFTQAIEAGKFEKMQALERSKASRSIRLRPPKSGNPEGLKVRRGVVGGYRDYLSRDDLAFLNSYLRENLDDYYECYRYKD
jgi:hypothetical protein